ncbi:MAG: hypothetical protein ABSD41_08250 [Candidatus Bathyarchaeia archaeon]|jgi:hypothetical protein
MTLKGTGHGLTTADKVKAVVIDFVRKRFAIKSVVEVEEIQFDGAFYQVRGHYTTEEKTTQQFSVRLNKDGDIIEGTDAK